jgi:hypothetical protein
MNANVLTKHYARLTPEERFRLIVAASARGDEAEQLRLQHAGQRLILRLPDHSPWSNAFSELSVAVFLDCLEEAAKHRDLFEFWDDAGALQDRVFELYLAQGFILRAKIAGWKLFCERLSIPAFVAWQSLPGFQRLQHVVQLLEDDEFWPAAAFCLDGMIRWLRRTRASGELALETLISPERFADDLNKVFRQRVNWWGG